MYDSSAIHSVAANEVTPDGTTALPEDSEMAETALVSLHRLQSALVELSIALNETLHDKRGNAAACLQRAQVILHGADGTPRYSSAMGASKGLAPWQVRKVLSHIETNLGDPIRNNDLASLARLSTFHFNVAFRNSVGDSPHQYIIRRRIERAQGLMLSTDKALSEIAAECGLADQAHFTRLFRRFVGESPASWRRARANPSP